MPSRPTWTPPNSPSTPLITTILLGVLFVGIGCGQQDVATSSPAVTLLETWDVVYMADTKVGSIHTVF